MMEPETPAHKPRKFLRRRDARPSELLEAALALFAEKGFASTRLADVARRAGVSAGTVCLYFPTKEALFREMIRHYLQPVISDQQAIVDQPGSPRSRLIRLLQAKAAALQRSQVASLGKIIIAEIGSFPEVGRDFYDSVIEPSLVQVTRLVAEGIACGEFRPVDPRVQAHLLISPMPHTMVWHACYGHLDPQRTSPGTLIAAHLEAGLRALDREPAQPPPPSA